LLRTAPAFIISSVIMAFWHFPFAYDAALHHNWVHVMQHQFFLVAGILLWWPILSRSKDSPPLSPPGQSLYLFLLTIPSGLIGAFITFAGPGLYTPYENAAVRPWGFSLKSDQQLAGLMMWVGMNAIFLTLLTVIFLGWANRQEKADEEMLREQTRARRARAIGAMATAGAAPAAARATASHSATSTVVDG
jgi:cytochrome c oxidase assembly factor CtaG